MKTLSRFFKRLYSFLYFQSWNFGLWTPPDRKFLTTKLFPHYDADPKVKEVLFVGVRRYTSSYPSFFKTARFVTIDVDQNQERYGAAEHRTGDVRHLSQWNLFPRGADLVFMNGVIGFGLNDLDSVEEAILALSKNMRPGAHVVFGINPDYKNQPPLGEIRNLTSYFECRPSPLTEESHHHFSFPLLPGAKHQYHFYARK